MKTNNLDFDAKALREKILDLAMRGKLVEQDPADEPASVLLEKIKAEKAELVKEGKIKKSKKLPEITDDEKPFDIPESWEWVRLGEVIDTHSGKLLGKKYLKINGKFLVYGANGIIGKYDEYNTLKNSVLIGRVGFYAGNVVIAKENCWVTDNSLIVENHFNLNSRWLMYFLRGIHLGNLTSRTAQPVISNKKISNAIIPLPPLEEQSRIAAKIAQLFTLLRKVESSTEQYQEFKKMLREKVLDLAMRGKLVKQDPADEPASVLLEKIKADTSYKVASKVTKKIRIEAHANEDKFKYRIPDNWVWTKLGKIIYKLTDGAHKRPEYTSQGVPFLSVKDMSSGIIDFSKVKYISYESHEEIYPRCNPERGDLILSKVGTTGVPAVVETNKKFDLFVSVALLKFNSNYVNRYFLKYLIQSPLVQEQARLNTRGVGNKNWVLRDIAGTVVPLPPLEEQKRIIKKIDKIYSLV